MKLAIMKSVLVAACLGIAGCKTIDHVQVWENPTVKIDPSKTFRIEAFENISPQKDQDNFPEAGQIVAMAMESALLNAGYRIMDSNATHCFITGTVEEYFQGRFGGKNTTVGFSVKATDAESGEILWKASHSITTEWEYNYAPSLLAKRVAGELVDSLSGIK
jgi:hypothetical protein